MKKQETFEERLDSMSNSEIIICDYLAKVSRTLMEAFEGFLNLKETSCKDIDMNMGSCFVGTILFNLCLWSDGSNEEMKNDMANLLASALKKAELFKEMHETI